MDRLVFVEVQRDRPAFVRIVVGSDLDGAGGTTIDDAQESLPVLGVRGGRKQVYPMQGLAIH